MDEKTRDNDWYTCEYEHTRSTPDIHSRLLALSSIKPCISLQPSHVICHEPVVEQRWYNHHVLFLNIREIGERSLWRHGVQQLGLTTVLCYMKQTSPIVRD